MESKEYITVPGGCVEAACAYYDERTGLMYCTKYNKLVVDPDRLPNTTSQQVLEQIRREIDKRLEVLP